MYRLVFAQYQGLYTVGKWAMWIAVAISIVISMISFLRVRLPFTPGRQAQLRMRGISISSRRLTRTFRRQ